VKFKQLQEKYGYFYPAKDGEELPGISVTEWQSYRAKVVTTLQQMFHVGDVLSVNAATRTIQDVLTVDGVKVVFDDHSWFLLRPSGTEAKFRYYYETVGKDGREKLAGYKTTVSALLAKARTAA
jgi:phosphomannomutase